MTKVSIEVKPVDNRKVILVGTTKIINDISVDSENTSNDILVDTEDNSNTVVVNKINKIAEISVNKGCSGCKDGIDGNDGIDGITTNTVTEYVSEYETDTYIYSGYRINSSPIIKKYREGTELFAQGITNVTTDWDNRLNLTYI